MFPELMVRAVGAGRIWGHWGKRCLYGGLLFRGGVPAAALAQFYALAGGSPSLLSCPR